MLHPFVPAQKSRERRKFLSGRRDAEAAEQIKKLISITIIGRRSIVEIERNVCKHKIYHWSIEGNASSAE